VGQWYARGTQLELLLGAGLLSLISLLQDRLSISARVLFPTWDSADRCVRVGRRNAPSDPVCWGTGPRCAAAYRRWWSTPAVLAVPSAN